MLCAFIISPLASQVGKPDVSYFFSAFDSFCVHTISDTDKSRLDASQQYCAFFKVFSNTIKHLYCFMLHTTRDIKLHIFTAQDLWEMCPESHNLYVYHPSHTTAQLGTSTLQLAPNLNTIQIFGPEMTLLVCLYVHCLLKESPAPIFSFIDATDLADKPGWKIAGLKMRNKLHSSIMRRVDYYWVVRMTRLDLRSIISQDDISRLMNLK